jgi:hypothetical protein
MMGPIPVRYAIHGTVDFSIFKRRITGLTCTHCEINVRVYGVNGSTFP